VLAVVGLARNRVPADLPYQVAAALAHRWFRSGQTPWQSPSPVVWPPPETYPGMRRIAAAVLPGAWFRRLLLWRYSLVWVKPG
jgi:hypothetical protein